MFISELAPYDPFFRSTAQSCVNVRFSIGQSYVRTEAGLNTFRIVFAKEAYTFDFLGMVDALHVTGVAFGYLFISGLLQYLTLVCFE